MLINWFTVGAQLVNFAVLVWLMKHFLYQPVLRAMDAREKKIASQASDMAQKEAALHAAQQQLDASKEAFDKERGALLAKATADATGQRERIVSDAQAQADALRARQQAAAQQDAAALSDQMRQLATTEIFQIARKTLTDLASSDLEERIGEVFTRRLRQLAPAAKETLAAAFKRPDANATVRSYFDLPAGVRATLQNALNETFGANIPLQFATAPATVCGIELSVGGQKLSWNIDEYLRLFQQEIVAFPARKGPGGDVLPDAAGAAINGHALAQAS
jgi:F-type H+-transporting ATPase subunit b